MLIRTTRFVLVVLLCSNLWTLKNSMPGEIEILGPITVTGSLIPKKLKETGSSITIISEEEINESGAKYLSQILSGSAGFQVYRSGGPHTLSRAFIRGNETDHTLVLFNGVKMVDPATGRGSVDLERITLSGIERIEVLRGSQSALYGSEAIGGVINIISKRGNNNYEKYTNFEASNRLDKNMNTGLSGKIKNVYFSVNFNHSEGPGISAAEKSLGYEENDSYNIDNGNFTLDYDIDSNTKISLDTRLFTSEIQEDDAPNGPIYDADMHTNLLDWQSAISLKKKYNLFSVDISASIAKARRYQLKEDRKFRRYIADLNTGRIKFILPLSAFDNIIFGTETERSHMEQRTEYNDYDFKVSSTSKIISYSNNYYNNFFIDASLRTNSHDAFGSSATYRIASSYLIPSSGLRLHSSYGTGYRAPTLDEIYGSYGNSSVKEERSRSRDIGVEYTSKNNKFTSDITLFSTQIDNLIGYGGAPGYLFENQGSAKTNGLELFFNYIYKKNFEINFSYNFLTTNNNGKSLQRRRKHSGKTTFKWIIDEFPEIVSYSTIEYYSKARDDAFTGGHLSGYALIHSNLNYTIDSETNVYVKIENLLDQKYHLSDTAGTYGRTLSMGMSLNF